MRTIRAGFTVIEVVVVVALIAIVSALAAPFLGNSTTQEDLDAAVAGAKDAVREAQVATMSGRSATKYGVHFQGDRYTWFVGAAYVPADPGNVEHELPSDVTITAVTFTPGGACTLPAGTGNCDIHFANRRGVPTESGSVTFTAAGGATRTLTLNAVGMVDHD